MTPTQYGNKCRCLHFITLYVYFHIFKVQKSKEYKEGSKVRLNGFFMVFLMVQPLKKGDEPWGLKHCKAGIPEDEKYD